MKFGKNLLNRQFFKRFSTTINIGNVTAIKGEKLSSKVPYGYLKENNSQEELENLRWMVQKDQLDQDMFLLGPPDSRKRRLAFTYAELLNKEVEYLCLSSDTTESDLKQRREIENGTMIFKNQPPCKNLFTFLNIY